jgi:MYXO-CTERM domain-containing protein
MIGALLVVTAHVASGGGCASASCGDPCTNCAWQPVAGTDPDVAGWMSLFEDVSTRTVDADWPAIDDVNAGPARDPVAAEFPCRLLPAIGAVESAIQQFCSGVTVISFDCGFGVTQVTSGADLYPGIESRADINVAAGASILVDKWNGASSYGGPIGDSAPGFVESWYFAVWAYNGFGYYNNPNNPDFPANRPPFNGPGQLSRGSYPYQELEWGYLRNPLVKEGAPMWQPLEVTYPDNADVPDVAGLFDTGMPLPTPAHEDPCGEECPPAGCPPADARELILDDLDARFSIVGESTEHGEGGFRDHFRSLAIAPADAPTATARFEGTAPSSGTFDVAMFIPLDPATCEDVRVRVTARDGVTELTQNQNVSGGFFQTLGQVALRAGEDVVVEVANGSSDPDSTHRIGVDAFRFVWRGEGEGEEGEGEGEGQGDGGGEGEGDARTSGCACASTSAPDALAALLAIGLIRRRGLRRNGL